LAIDGDLRFVSHHDCIRAVERIATRASVPVKYSEGFNPRPLVALPCARPVAVATRDDLLVIRLTQALDGEHVVGALNRHAPPGMRFGPAGALEGKGTIRPRSIEYALELSDHQVGPVADKLAQLRTQESWPVERTVTVKRGRRREMTTRVVDIQGLVSSLKLQDRTLGVTLTCRGDFWPRPGEVLRLLGLDERADLARLVRVSVEYEFQGRTWTVPKDPCRQHG